MTESGFVIVMMLVIWVLPIAFAIWVIMSINELKKTTRAILDHLERRP